MQGVLLPRSETIFVILTVFPGNPVPEVKYINHIARHPRSRDKGRVDDVNYMYGYITDLHEGKTFYTVPIYLERRSSEDSIVSGLIDNKDLGSRSVSAYEFFKRGLVQTLNKFAFHEGV
jgi:hypothetical protein